VENANLTEAIIKIHQSHQELHANMKEKIRNHFARS